MTASVAHARALRYAKGSVPGLPPSITTGTLPIERLWRSLKHECVYLHA